MGRRLILDTCVLIAFERGRLKPGDFITSGDDVALAAITLTELRVGALLAEEARRPAREAAVARAAQTFEFLPCTDLVSLRHAELLVWTRSSGSPRGAFDLIIAATAAATGRTLVTTDNAAAFAGLPGVNATAPEGL
jgi:tRNA(fMet)-specific endonuclease VapC